MIHRVRGLSWSLVAALPLSLAALAPRPAASFQSARGYVYTINNDGARNAVIVLERQADGALAEVPGSPFPAGGMGLAGGDIDEQGAIQLHGGHLLAVNPGSDSIAAFRRSAGGSLQPVEGSPFASGGPNPLSLSVHGDLVYVANQGPAYARPAARPNITGFRMGSNGALSPIPNSTITFPAGRGPAQVAFSPRGDTLVATSGFQDSATSQIHSYRVQEDGTLKEGPDSPFVTRKVSGTVGFSWDPTRPRIYVSNFRGSAITVFDVDPASGGIRQVGEEYGDGQAAACWTAISPNGRNLYVANFVSNSVSTFAIRPDGTLQLRGSTPRRGAAAPDTKDLALSADGRFLYAVGSSAKQITVFRLDRDGLPVELPSGRSPHALNSGQNTTGLAAD